MTMPMIHLADVYTQHATTGDFSVLAKAALECRKLVPSLTDKGQSLPARAENAAVRKLVWDISYVMPKYAQLLIDGERWNVMPTTIQEIPSLTGSIIERRALIVQAGT